MDRIRLRNKCTHKIRIDNVFARSEYLLLRNSTAGEIRLRYDPSGFAFFKLQNRVLRSTAAKNRTRIRTPRRDRPDVSAPFGLRFSGRTPCRCRCRRPVWSSKNRCPESPCGLAGPYRYSASGSGCLRSGRHSSKRRPIRPPPAATASIILRWIVRRASSVITPFPTPR